MIGYALIDYDNVKEREEESSLDVECNLDSIENAVIESALKMGQIREMKIRLYGGWVTEKGFQSRSTLFVWPLLKKYRGLRRGVRISMELALAPMCCHSIKLKGLVRKRYKRNEQKMVDTMLVVDAAFIAAEFPVGVYSDDDDMIPGLLAANAVSTRSAVWYRFRDNGVRRNDEAVIAQGIEIYSMRGML